MKLISLLIGVSLIGVAFAVPGYMVCEEMCFDIIKNKNTNGFDPQFLSMNVVKQNCKDAFNDGVKLGYCDVSLGTL